MSKTIKYRIVEIAHKPRNEKEYTYYIIQRKMWFWWKNRMFCNKVEKYDFLDTAVRNVKDWHDRYYSETYTKKNVVKSIEFWK